MVISANGMDETAISSSAGAAARAKNASSAAAQMDDARVVKPMGLRISVAGSSFMVRRNTRAAPVRIPGRTSGSVTVRRTDSGPRPRLRAASSNSGRTWSNEVRREPTAAGRNSVTYATASIASD